MAKIDFSTRVKKALEGYSKKLGFTKGGTWRGKGPYAHILPIKQGKNKEDVVKEFNVLECCKQEPFLLQDKCHQYAHHLNSSQLMCYNYFRPYINNAGKPTKELFCILKSIGVQIEYSDDAKCEFEYEQEEDSWKHEGQQTRFGFTGRTNFDFYVKKSGEVEVEVFFEIKYTENGFGTAKNDDAHKNKYCKFYKKKIEGCKALKNKIEWGDEFRKNYQIIRNVIRATDQKKYVIFIYDCNNTKIGTQLENFIKKYVSDEYKNNIKGVTWQNLVGYLKPSEHYDQFYCKYLSYKN